MLQETSAFFLLLLMGLANLARTDDIELEKLEKLEGQESKDFLTAFGQPTSDVGNYDSGNSIIIPGNIDIRNSGNFGNFVGNTGRPAFSGGDGSFVGNTRKPVISSGGEGFTGSNSGSGGIFVKNTGRPAISGGGGSFIGTTSGGGSPFSGSNRGSGGTAIRIVNNPGRGPIDPGRVSYSGPNNDGPFLNNNNNIINNNNNNNFFVDTSMKPIPGIAGVDYKNLAYVPFTGFTCDGQLPGYYADTSEQAQCQVFHICQQGGRMDSFLCPNGTVFNQQYFVCDWWFNFDCFSAQSFYNLNAEIGKVDQRNTFQSSNTIDGGSFYIDRNNNIVNIPNPSGTYATPGK